MAADPVSIVCEECACITGKATGWLAHLIDDPEEPDQEPYVVFYCPVCAHREFGWVSFRGVNSIESSADGSRELLKLERRMTGELFKMLAVKLALIVLAVAIAVVAGASAIWWDTLDPWLTGHPELAEWAVAGGTAILAVATFVLGIQASREGAQVAKQVELQQRQLAASERPIVYPITPHEWLESLGEGGRWLAFRNGGTGIARNVRGRLWSYGEAEADLFAQTFGANDHARVWLAEERSVRNWWGAEGYVIYEDIQGYEWQSRFRYESDGSQVWAKLTQYGRSADLGDPAAAFPREGWAGEDELALPGPSRYRTTDLRTTQWP